MIMKWIVPSFLINDLEACLVRIPIDLKIWEKECKHLKKSKRKKDMQKYHEYKEMYAYYLGKIMAYFWVLEILEDTNFVKKYAKKHRIYVTDRERGRMNFKP